MEIKGIVHIHSTYSYDGKESLASLKEFLQKEGITFCCLTEHTDFLTVEQAQMFVQECRALSGSQFVFIPGFEVPYKDAHILLIGTEAFLGQKADAQMLRQWSERAQLTILAHPVRNRFAVDETMGEVIDGIEIWNQQYDGKKVPRPRAAQLLRALQQKQHGLFATGGIDFHRREHFGAPLFKLEVERITADAILAALKNGTYVFGTDKIAVAPSGLWKGSGSVAHNLLSFVSIGVIVLGKNVNKFLAMFGLRFPNGLKRFIRSRV
jgi:predicted metal-dependent phosphoesterase TrpH